MLRMRDNMYRRFLNTLLAGFTLQFLQKDLLGGSKNGEPAAFKIGVVDKLSKQIAQTGGDGLKLADICLGLFRSWFSTTSNATGGHMRVSFARLCTVTSLHLIVDGGGAVKLSNGQAQGDLPLPRSQRQEAARDARAAVRRHRGGRARLHVATKHTLSKSCACW